MSNMLSKYPPPLYEIMRDDGAGTERKRVLDLGCGNGSWWAFISFQGLTSQQLITQDYGFSTGFPQL